ncbi:Similar to rbm42: RNA-binding protein 42 (Xenopus tropicalis) [Cotesia congregata]|uniref:Similar to rbm42: RNA-binding protein 42 (Xenopus tropicalis) n=1 Tax=Cotesia congregata TaxID=51543 RepID=A0A8J2H8N2_COTCN|nr:Similar to rbm42: RNA-binding protein 42 (Xenopus tropicalis) [Cotesia congregata]
MPTIMRPVIGVNTYSQVARQLEQHELPAPSVAAAAAAATLAFSPMIGFPPPPPPPPPLLIPPQVARQDDFRLFCGDLGNDVTDEMLVRVFSKYPSFQRAKVIRDKRTNKTKGFGFISFKDPYDCGKALKEMGVLGGLIDKR